MQKQTIFNMVAAAALVIAIVASFNKPETTDTNNLILRLDSLNTVNEQLFRNDSIMAIFVNRESITIRGALREMKLAIEDLNGLSQPADTFWMDLKVRADTLSKK